jgi:RND family efflux transporter MFP subunit
LNESRVNSERLATLVKEGIAPQSELDAADASRARAEASLESAREQVRLWQAQVRQRQSELAITQQRLTDTAIRSPVTGTVQARRAGVGEYLAVGAPVVEIVEAGPLRLRLALSERDATRVKSGQVVRVIGSQDEHVVEGQVARVAPMLDVETRSLLIEADIGNPGQLRPGNFVTARIVTGTRAAPAVPATAIVTFAGLQKVLIVEREQVVERVVTVGAKSGEWVEITSGLKVGEAVIAVAGSLQQGQAVSVEEQRQAP